MFSFICVWTHGWVNNREAGDLRRYRAHYDVIVMSVAILISSAHACKNSKFVLPVSRLKIVLICPLLNNKTELFQIMAWYQTRGKPLSKLMNVYCSHAYIYIYIFAMICPPLETWWCIQMEIFSKLMSLCEGKPPVTGGFPEQWPVTRSSDVFYDLHMNKRLSKQTRCR